MLTTRILKSAVIMMIMALLYACNAKTSGVLEPGMEYNFINKADGAKPEIGEVLTLNITYKNEKDSVLGSSLDSGMPFGMKKDSTWGTSEGFEDCLNILSKGDSAVFKLAAKNIFKDQMPPDLTAESVITVNVGVVDVLPEEVYRKEIDEKRAAERRAQMEAYRKNILETTQEIREEQGKTIDEYLAANELEAQTTASGLRYVVIEEGTGAKPVAGDTVRVDYTGSLLDGKVFDSSVEEVAKANEMFDERRPYEPIKFQLGVGNVIMGWDEGISQLNEGTKAKLLIPSPLAYGERGGGNVIPPNAILVFDVQLVEVIK